jgi:hypothetical protein
MCLHLEAWKSIGESQPKGKACGKICEESKRMILTFSSFFFQLTVEEYVQTMDKLTTDMRFTVFNICYKRILVIWIVTAFTILLCLLFSGFQVTNK